MDISIILFVILHFIVFTMLISSMFLWLQRRVDPKPRIYLMIFSLGTAFSLIYRLYMTYETGTPTVYPILPIIGLTSGFFELLLLYLYPLEVIRPNWLTCKRVFLLFLPWLVISFMLLVIPLNFRELSSFSEILEYIGEFNVWIRLVILVFCIIPYTMMLLKIPYKWQNNSVDSTWMYKYVLGVQGIGLLFCTFMLTGSVAVKSLHFLYSIFFCLYVIYQELFLRLFPHSADKTVVDKAQPKDSAEKSETTKFNNPLWEKLTTTMNQNELWSEPDITLEDLAKRLDTNRTTLSTLIQQRGYSGYTEFINRRRIEVFIEKIKNDNSINIQELFYGVGFRSKSTAIRNFRLYMKCSPNEYIQQIVLKNKAQ